MAKVCVIWLAKNYYSGCATTMADDSGAVIVCGLLCFAQNKMNYVPMDTLADVLRRGFREEEVEKAKDTLFGAAAMQSFTAESSQELR